MELIYVKDVDKSLLKEGFTIRYSLLNRLISKVGELEIGESRPISIILNGTIYSNIQLKNLNFNRTKYATHVEMYQVRYSPSSEFTKALRATFPELYAYIKNCQDIKDRLKMMGQKSENIKVPDDMRCSVAFYETDSANVWEAVPIFSNDYKEVKKTIHTISADETRYEQVLLNDEDACIVKEQHWVKVRKLDRNVCQNLKQLYGYRCQICGQLITAPYTDGDEKVIDAHHIVPFTESCNNNFSNIMILCPNHHRVVHACHPVFKVRTKEFVFPNGYHEKLKLNKHL